MKKKQYVYKITLYKIKGFEPNITNKKQLFYKKKQYLHELYNLQIFNELKGDILSGDIISYIKDFLTE